jgi:hypothetical protein
VQPLRDLVVRDLADGITRHLRPAYRLAWIATQTGQAADRLGEETFRPGQADVPVVGLVAHRDVRAESEAGEEVARRIAVPDEAVHDPDVRRARVEVQPDGERQPVAVLPLQPDHYPHGSVLLHDDLVDARRRLLPCPASVLVGSVLLDTDQPDLPRHLAFAVLNPADEVRLGENPGHVACGHGDRSAGLDYAHRLRG